MSSAIKNVLVTGGAGYVGSVLIHELLARDYKVKVLDLYLFGEDVLDEIKDHHNLEQIKGDIRDQNILKQSLNGCDAVIHLACISNDPSFELDPELGRSINFDSFDSLVRLSKEAGVQRFIYASSSSVYGVSDAPDVTEEHPLAPLTDYSNYKALCEPILLEEEAPNFVPVVIRPATVCGYSPRLRLDLTVNILTNHAVNLGQITIFGGSQTRPNIHISDMVDLYARLLEFPNELISGKIFNAGYENYTVQEIADMVCRVVSHEMLGRRKINLVVTPTKDTRSYHISSEKIKRELGFVPRHSIEDAVVGLIRAFQSGKIQNPMTDSRYYNIKLMRNLQLK